METQRYAVINFETTGLSPAHGARPTEIAGVMVCGGEIVDRYLSLTNPVVPIPVDIQAFTGIINSIVRAAPSIRQVMTEALAFADRAPIVAHDAAFEKSGASGLAHQARWRRCQAIKQLTAR